MDILTPNQDGTITIQTVVYKFICVYTNGETYVTWAETQAEAIETATHKSGYGKPWKVLKPPQ